MLEVLATMTTPLSEPSRVLLNGETPFSLILEQNQSHSRAPESESRQVVPFLVKGRSGLASACITDSRSISCPHF
jgi:hypothetical protein